MSVRKVDPSQSPTIQNRKALHRYEVLDRVEAGIALQGCEVKSIRAGQVTLDEAFARVSRGQMVLHGLHVNAYVNGDAKTQQPRRDRTLLLHRREIARLAERASQQRLTLIPLSLYFKAGRVKVELGVCKGKNAADKRESLKAKEVERDVQQELRRRR